MKASWFERPKRATNKNLKMNQTKLNRKKVSGRGGFATLIGLDWGSQRHALCLYDCATGKREASTLEHTPEAIAQWGQGLEQRFGGKKISVWNRPKVPSFIRSRRIPPFPPIRPTRQLPPATASPLNPPSPTN